MLCINIFLDWSWVRDLLMVTLLNLWHTLASSLPHLWDTAQQLALNIIAKYLILLSSCWSNIFMYHSWMISLYLWGSQNIHCSSYALNWPYYLSEDKWYVSRLWERQGHQQEPNWHSAMWNLEMPMAVLWEGVNTREQPLINKNNSVSLGLFMLHSSCRFLKVSEKQAQVSHSSDQNFITHICMAFLLFPVSCTYSQNHCPI